MKLPEPDDLAIVAGLIANGRSDTPIDFATLGPQARMDVLRFAQSALLAELIDELTDVIDNIETDTTTIAAWFKHSKLFEP